MNTEMVRQDEGVLDLFRGWTPAALRAQIAHEKEMRAVIIEYYQSCMVEGHHYYRLDGDERKKPALTKEGALALCHLFRARPHPEPPVETWTADGHYAVRSSVSIIEQGSGQVIAEGVGSCSTRESKYAYRMGTRVCPSCGKAAIIKGREEFGGGWLCFRKKDGCGTKFRDGDHEIESQPTGRVPNEDLADQYNTALKMSNKRATVDAALAIPLVSEIFTQDLEEQIDERKRDVLMEPTRGATVEPSADRGTPRQRTGTGTPSPSTAPDTEPKMSGKPPSTDINQLIELMERTYQDPAVVQQKLRAVLGIPVGQECTPARIRFTMTRAHYQTLQDEATAYALANAVPDDDVQDFSGPEPSTLHQDARSDPGEGREASETEDLSTGQPDSLTVPAYDPFAEDPPTVEVDAQGVVTAPWIRVLRQRLDGYHRDDLFGIIDAEVPQMTEGRYGYWWMELGRKPAAKV